MRFRKNTNNKKNKSYVQKVVRYDAGAVLLPTEQSSQLGAGHFVSS